MESAPEVAPDSLLAEIADYLTADSHFGSVATETAALCLMDSLGCAMLALNYPACARFVGPVVPGATLPGGARVPGTDLELDPVQAALALGAMIRWLDYNDTWLAAEWGHPSDNIGGILTTADYLSRWRIARNGEPMLVRDLLPWIIRAHEIQGVLALENSFNRLGIDHVILVRVATAAVVTAMLGGTREQIVAAVSNAWIDGGSLRVYRHGENTGPRKSWAAGDATSRGVRLALMALKGEPGYPTALTAPTWGFHDVVNRGKPLTLGRPLGNYVMEHVLFKIGYPAEFHGQTAVEAAIRLHLQVAHRLDEIERIRLETQESAVRIIDKRGPLRNPADRDHCIQYMTAVGLLKGALSADDYENQAAADPRIDQLRDRMEVVENPRYSRDYLDPDLRSVANAVQVFFKDGTATDQVAIEYPLGHPRRREEGMPLLRQKFEDAVGTRFAPERVQVLAARFADSVALRTSAVHELVNLFVP